MNRLSKAYRQAFGDPAFEKLIEALQEEDEEVEEPDEESPEPMEAEESRYIDKQNARAINKQIG